MNSGEYPIDLYPGQSKVVQLLNPDGTPYIIPAGATIEGWACNVVGTQITSLFDGNAIADASKGMIRATLPDTPQVRAYRERYLIWDATITSGGFSKRLPLSRLRVLRSTPQT